MLGPKIGHPVRRSGLSFLGPLHALLSNSKEQSRHKEAGTNYFTIQKRDIPNFRNVSFLYGEADVALLI